MSVDGFLVPTFGGTPVVNREVANLYRQVTNDAYDLGTEEFVNLTPTLGLKNDTTVAQNLIFELEGYSKKHTYWDLGSILSSAQAWDVAGCTNPLI